MHLQHIRFLEIHEQDDFVREYMEAIGHHDFGAGLKPVNFGNWLADAADPKDLALELAFIFFQVRLILRTKQNDLGGNRAICRGGPGLRIADHRDGLHRPGLVVCRDCGTVREFQWTNPHSWLQLQVSEGGRTVEYSIELGSPNSMSRRGWRKTTFMPGDKVTVVMNPMRDGAPGGALVYAIDREGKRMSWR
mgnify:CR=1 FL=1